MGTSCDTHAAEFGGGLRVNGAIGLLLRWMYLPCSAPSPRTWGLDPRSPRSSNARKHRSCTRLHSRTLDFVKTASSRLAHHRPESVPRVVRFSASPIGRPPGRKRPPNGGWRRMAEIDEAGAGDEESTPPSLTPVCIRSSSRFMLLLVSFICVFIDPCEHQLRPEIRRDKINNFATFTNGTGARHSGRVATNRDVHSFLIVCRG
jgi:hypothetical protein